MAKTDSTIFYARSDGQPLDKLNKMGNFFNGTDPTTFSDIELDPFVGGFSVILWVKLPSWFEKDNDLKNYRVMTQKAMHSFQGITDAELQTTTQQYGFAGNEVNFATGINRNNTDFTIGFKEYSGSPILKLHEKWINYIRDINTGIATYPKEFDVEYSARNHSGVLLYISLRPDVNNSGHDNIERAFLFSNVIPTNIPLSSLYNYELGSQDSPTSIDIQFKGVPLFGKAIDEYARKMLKEEILTVSEDNNNGMLFLDSTTQAGDEGTELLTTGILKDIYNSDNNN